MVESLCEQATQKEGKQENTQDINSPEIIFRTHEISTNIHSNICASSSDMTDSENISTISIDKTNQKNQWNRDKQTESEILT